MTRTVEECARDAVEAFEGLRRDQYLNCCQSVMKALGGLTPVKKDLLARIGTGFGGGFAGMGEICGALTAGIILISAKFGVRGDEPHEVFRRKKNRCKELVREFYRWFKDEYGCLDCREITGIDGGTEEGLALYTDLKQAHKVPCHKIIENSVRKLFEILTKLER